MSPPWPGRQALGRARTRAPAHGNLARGAGWTLTLNARERRSPGRATARVERAIPRPRRASTT
eukprot:12683247-Alexandrium_andersonii.AAC.1